MITQIANTVRGARDYYSLPERAKAEHRADRQDRVLPDPGLEAAITAAFSWLCRAQDYSPSHDGGVARHFSLISGWGTSYPETTGYIVSTILRRAIDTNDSELLHRGRVMLNWLKGIQLSCGAFQGGQIDAVPVAPVTFNTGQILLGLADGVRFLGEEYRESMRRAADWLVQTQDPDGCWRRFSSPFAAPGEKVYDTHVAWGLFEAARLEPDRGYGKAALRNIAWALRQQRTNGWFDKGCMGATTAPSTHSIGYTLRGVIEAYRYESDPSLLAASCRTADALVASTAADGFLAGQLDHEWGDVTQSVCLTGNVQIADCLLMLYEFTGETMYRDTAYALNKYVRCTVSIDGPVDIRGGVKGSYPVYGNYGRYEYLNWAAKFFLDSNLRELRVRAAAQS